MNQRSSSLHPHEQPLGSNKDYLNFIRNNHDMIERHLASDFEHPYKDSLLKSYSVKGKSKPFKAAESEIQKSNRYGALINGDAKPLPLHRISEEKHTIHEAQGNQICYFKQERSSMPLPKIKSSELNQHKSSTKLSDIPPIQYTSKQKAPENLTQKVRASLDSNTSKEVFHSLQPRYNHSETSGKRSLSQYESLKMQKGPQQHSSLARQIANQKLVPFERSMLKEQALSLVDKKREEISQFLKSDKNSLTDVTYKSKVAHLHPTSSESKTHATMGRKISSFLEASNQKAKRHGSSPPKQSVTGQPKVSELPNILINNQDCREKATFCDEQLPGGSVHAKGDPTVEGSSWRVIPGKKSSEVTNVFAGGTHAGGAEPLKVYKKVEKNNIALKIRPINEKNMKSLYDYENALIRQKYEKLVSLAKDSSHRRNRSDEPGSSGQPTMPSGDLNKQDDPSNQPTPSSEQQMSNQDYLSDLIREKAPGEPNARKGREQNSQEVVALTRNREGTSKVSFQKYESHIPPQEGSDDGSLPLHSRPCNQSQRVLGQNSGLASNPPLTKIQSNAEVTLYDRKIHLFQDFFFKMLFAHRQFSPLQIRELQTTVMKGEEKYRFHVGKGNNALLVKSLMKRRFWWQIEEDPKKANFVWTQLKVHSFYQFQRKCENQHRFYKFDSIQQRDKKVIAEQTEYSQGSQEAKVEFVKDLIQGHDEEQEQKGASVGSPSKNLERSPRKALRARNTEKAVEKKSNVIFEAPFDQDCEMKIFTKFDKYVFSTAKSKAASGIFSTESTTHKSAAAIPKRLQYFPRDFFESSFETEGISNEKQKTKLEVMEEKISQDAIVEAQRHREEARMHNHFEFNNHIGNKKALFYNLRYYCAMTGKNVFNIVPLTFHVKKGIKDPEYTRFLKHFKALESGSQVQKAHKEESGKGKGRKQRNVWIVKPGEVSNRGSGIQVFDELYEINNVLKRKQSHHKNGQEMTYIIQKYIDRPLLYRNRKFDIRHFMLITRLWGKMRVYFFGEGYIRTSSYEYDINDVCDTEVHLTNDAIQQECHSYGKYEEGNKLSYNDFQKYLDSEEKRRREEKDRRAIKNSSGKPSKKAEVGEVSFARDFYPQMKEIAVDVVKSSYLTLDPSQSAHNFEIFGLDFMIDRDYKVWLIEVNTNPCLELSSKLQERVIPQMLEQSLRLSLDLVFPPKYHYANTSKHLMPDYSLEKLKCELIFDEDRDGLRLNELYGEYAQKLRSQNKRTIDEILKGEIDEDEEDEVYESEGKEIELKDPTDEE